MVGGLNLLPPSAEGPDVDDLDAVLLAIAEEQADHRVRGPALGVDHRGVGDHPHGVIVGSGSGRTIADDRDHQPDARRSG
jgi:hypothetical protein